LFVVKNIYNSGNFISAMSGIVEEAYTRLTSAPFSYTAALKYSNRFNEYNANVKKIGNSLHFQLSTSWKKVNKEIVIGLLQELLIKILKLPPTTTTNTDLYNNFIKNLHKTSRRIDSDASLVESFNRINSRYFHGIIEMPNLVWGNTSRRKLASYDYHTDTITVSSLFRESPAHIIDYLVYHELLHKKLQFKNKNGRSIHHSREFKNLEKQFDNSEEIENEISRFLKSKRMLLRKLF
jgi:predicted metal-dependent hydrolase